MGVIVWGTVVQVGSHSGLVVWGENSGGGCPRGNS